MSGPVDYVQKEKVLELETLYLRTLQNSVEKEGFPFKEWVSPCYVVHKLTKMCFPRALQSPHIYQEVPFQQALRSPRVGRQLCFQQASQSLHILTKKYAFNRLYTLQILTENYACPRLQTRRMRRQSRPHVTPPSWKPGSAASAWCSRTWRYAALARCI